MKLHEYQAKQIFLQYGLPTPIGYICKNYYEVPEIINKLGTGPWVAKCQIHAGGRGKAGGVKLFNNQKDLSNFVHQWLGNRLITYQTQSQGQPVNQILIEAAININKELYLGAVIERSTCTITFIAASQGGVNIETIAKTNSNLIHKIIIDLLTGPQPYQGRRLAFKLGLMGKDVIQFTNIFMSLAKLFCEKDLMLAEINPLVLTQEGSMLCLDGKLIVDENALFRQPELLKMNDSHQQEPREAYAAQLQLNYVALDGNIGCMVNGAGLAMGTMDIIKLYGGNPANFLDVGGGVTKERVTEAFKIILSDTKVKAILVNIFGGIVSCDIIADGIISAVSEINIQIPIIIRLEGNNAEIGIKKISSINKSDIVVTNNLLEAAQIVVAATRLNMNVYFNS
ncbi:MAG: ADP-forming succinate--CoA ligase subunit beta [Candidatus Dasytiphilus stammeri]